MADELDYHLGRRFNLVSRVDLKGKRFLDLTPRSSHRGQEYIVLDTFGADNIEKVCIRYTSSATVVTASATKCAFDREIIPDISHSRDSSEQYSDESLRESEESALVPA